MNKGVWGGSLLLSLWGWVSGSSAQPVAWRAAPPAPPSVWRANVDAEPDSGVELGRPELLTQERTAVVRPRIPALILPASFDLPVASAPPAPLPSVLRNAAPNLAPATPSEVIAASASVEAPPAGGAADGASDSEFATDRKSRPSRSYPSSGAPLTLVGATGAPGGAVPLLPTTPPASASGPPGYNPWAPVGTAYGPWAAAEEDFFGSSSASPLHPRFYTDAEYLYWWLKGGNTPVLLTTSSPNDFGILGRPTTQIIYGGGDINDQGRSGARFTAGWWIDCIGEEALEVSGFFTGPRRNDFVANSGQFPTLARPFFNVNTNAQFSELVALPGVTTGSAVINAPGQFWGVEANLRCPICCGDCWRVNALGGVRYLDLDESIKITENVQGLSTAPAPFTNQTITVFDRFATHNQFYGGQIGVDGRYLFGRWSVDGRVKLALGATEQTIDIAGGQRFVAPDGTVATAKGGLLALPSNIGHFSQTRFSVVPEVGVNLGYQITPHLRGAVGYNFLYWTNVVRPGDQIDPLLNVSQIPNFPTNSPASNLNRPLVPFRQSDFWAQGITLSLEFTY